MESTENNFSQPVTQAEILGLDTWNSERDLASLRNFVSAKLGTDALANVDLGFEDYDLVA
jgi:hypothetical protein